MRRRILVAVAALTLVLGLSAAPASAIQYGQPDGSGHPFVGLVVFQDINHVPLWRCTGTLIAPSAVLTAGHCTGIDPGTGVAPSYAVVWFDAGPILRGNWDGPGTSCTGKSGYPCTGDASGTPHPNPGWTGYLTLPNTHDIGVVVLDAPYYGTGGKFGILPTAGILDSLATRRGLQDVTMTIVGYGLQSVKPVEVGIRERMIGQANVVQLQNALTDGYNVRLSSNPGVVSGGTCFGDSGGPIFYNDTNIVVGVNSFVLNANCKGSGYAYRVDTTWSLDFVNGFLP